MAGAAAPLFVESKIKQRPSVLFAKSYCPDSKRVVRLLTETYLLSGNQLEVVNIERRQDVNQIEDYFMVVCLSEQRELPQLWVGEKYVGNESKIMSLHDAGLLSPVFADAGLSVPKVNELLEGTDNSKSDGQEKVTAN